MTDKDRIYIRRFRWKFWLRWKYLRMMKRFAKEIHRDIEREKDTLIRCRKDMLEQKGYIDSAKSDNERKVHEIMYKQQCSFERTANFSGFLSLTTIHKRDGSFCVQGLATVFAPFFLSHFLHSCVGKIGGTGL